MANYLTALRKEILSLSRAMGVEHPAFVNGDHLALVDGHFGSESVRARFDYDPAWTALSPADAAAIRDLMKMPPVRSH